MCGICGQYNFQNDEKIDSKLLERMTNSMIHRGPDDSGTFIDNNVGIGFGHRRLSIIDLDSGIQPMHNANKTIWITFNGEIYNFNLLRTRLEKKGYEFSTKSDTEVIIYLYEEYDLKAFDMLNGIFAFAIYDYRKKCTILVRDHFGVKPLYYAFCGRKILFASEIKALLTTNMLRRELDHDAFDSFLTFRYNPSPQTLFKGIEKLLPGHYLKVVKNGHREIVSFSNYIPHTNHQISESEAIIEYQKLLEASVNRQMISDVPIGLLLSGGVDSAAIGYLMKLSSKSRLKTFTVGFKGKGDYNEIEDARRTSRFLDTDHFDIFINKKEYLRFFTESFFYTEEPISQSSISALYYVSNLASKYVKVVLAGQGADEPLAGYRRYLGEYYIAKYYSFLQFLPLKYVINSLPRNSNLKKIVLASQISSQVQRFLSIYTVFTPEQKKQIFKRSDFPLNSLNNEQIINNIFMHSEKMEDSLSKMLFVDTRLHLPDNLLLFGDKISMANSLEMRVPYLDIKLVRFLESLPVSYKIRKKTGKYIHKKALEKWLPEQIIYRKKRPFATPIDEWLQQGLAEKVKLIFNSKNAAIRSYFDLEYVNRMIDLHHRRKENYEKHLFLLLSFELWHRYFIEEKKIDRNLFDQK